MFDFELIVESGGKKGQDLDVSRTLSGMHSFSATVTELSIEALEELIQETYDDIYANFPVGMGTKNEEGQVEHTRDNIEFINSGNGRMEISYTSDVVDYIEFGTSAHGPKTANALHFFTPDGEEIFTKWVRGIPPRYIILKALMRLSSNLQNMDIDTEMVKPEGFE